MERLLQWLPLVVASVAVLSGYFASMSSLDREIGQVQAQLDKELSRIQAIEIEREKRGNEIVDGFRERILQLEQEVAVVPSLVAAACAHLENEHERACPLPVGSP